jgi:diguanylate cyclase (GGDEF)-like protein/PAS domain S-box-containing protein
MDASWKDEVSVGPTRRAMSWWRSLHFRVTFYQALLLVGMLSSTVAIMFTIERSLLVEKGQDIQEQMGNRVVSDLQNRIHLIESLTTSLANLGERLEPDEAVYKRVVPHILNYEKRESFVAGGGVWPGPYQFDPLVQRRSFFWGREPNGSLRYYDDYNDPLGSGYHQEEWYVPATYYKPGDAYWSRSYMDPYSYQAMVTCTVPMWREGQVVGVATVDLRLEGLGDILTEASRVLGGYMFAVDRNNKFLSFPDSDRVIHSYKDDAGKDAKEYFTAGEFAEKDTRFAPIAGSLEAINQRVIEAAEGGRQDFDQLAQKIAERSYQINQEEARSIVASMLDPSRPQEAETMEVARLFLERTPLLDEPVMVSIFMVPQTHWKIVAVTPMSKFYASADAATWEVGAYVMGFEVAGLLVMFLLIRRTLIRPLLGLSHQVRRVSEDGQELGHRLDDKAQDELGELAYEFNRRTDHLVHTLDELQEARDKLEERVVQRTAELAKSEAGTAQALQELKNQKLALDEHAIVVMADLHGNILYVNDKLCKLSGYSREELVDQDHSMVSNDENTSTFYEGLWKTISRGSIWRGEIRKKAKGGSHYWVESTIVPFKDGTGQITQYVVVSTDITANKNAQDKLRIDAEHDRLTHLPNRDLFQRRLEETFQLARADPEYKFAVLFFDFDRFKVINDSLGHNVGDALLCDIAKIMRRNLEDTDTLARFGGDEFVVMLRGLSCWEEAEQKAGSLLEILATPHQLGDHLVVSTASIGLVTNERRYEHAVDMIRDADAAMYQAKENGKARVVVFDSEMHERALDRLSLEADLRLAVSLGDQFRLVYQPIIELEAGRVAGFEALIRWDHPTRGVVSPLDFIPIAEDTGLIVQVGLWVLRTAAGQIADWNRRLEIGHKLKVNINVSKRQLLSPSFLEDVLNCRQEFDLQPGELGLEITESTLVDDRSDVVPLLVKLRGEGFPIVMDDFGTGVSSLSTLHEYPIDVLKIDQAFIRVLDRDRSLLAVVMSITNLADNLGIQTVAEGIESADIVGALQSINCTWGQGFYFARPMSSSDAEAYVFDYQQGLGTEAA